ncbi:TPA: hypothetical protein DEW47_01995 [Patescibacteria group bacterium]|nr:MAG: hypothetical protein UT71_C0002G0049 [Parcubacteria group bacterium GW2011_GWF2_40_10]KKR47826.1 MAG: hypothetical protein UT83_C0003G0039 [Parcubacteria group bacterium GW2011_GWA2_40_143]KKR60257.1 MAG: hypothetical protein UT97_C0003G0039 [Parcubacteria group bacterium GW2011_GWC2_40_31]KKR74486.1 MAG: hypothetical protein UU18_C0026G0002 [Parcubacteria group bacterium GW2011_GWB2_40_8]KKR77405.1 MAG: hypothetical protein UU20_C0008G0018 [Parcubacteria group bacterium GW2011_GWE2_40_
MSRNTVFAIDEFYHIYARGNDKRRVFLDTRDYYRLLSLFYLGNSKEIIHLSDHAGKSLNELLDIEIKDTLVDIGAYCLMPNHFHLLIKEREECGISKFMQKIMTGYTMYFNKKYEKTGSLFSSRFKAIHINEDNHLKHLLSYIHLNPVKITEPNWKENGILNKIKTGKFLDSYHYSSYLDYCSGIKRKQEKILNTKEFPKYFNSAWNFKKTIDEYLNVKVEP